MVTPKSFSFPDVFEGGKGVVPTLHSVLGVLLLSPNIITWHSSAMNSIFYVWVYLHQSWALVRSSVLRSAPPDPFSRADKRTEIRKMGVEQIYIFSAVRSPLF